MSGDKCCCLTLLMTAQFTWNTVYKHSGSTKPGATDSWIHVDIPCWASQSIMLKLVGKWMQQFDWWVARLPFLILSKLPVSVMSLLCCGWVTHQVTQKHNHWKNTILVISIDLYFVTLFVLQGSKLSSGLTFTSDWLLTFHPIYMLTLHKKTF